VTAPGSFRILSVDGGGMRGLIPAVVLCEIEKRLRERTDENAQLVDYFHLFAGTSTGGLIALGLTSPVRMDGEALVGLYRKRGPEIFARSLWQRVRTADGWLGPKYSPGALRKVLEEELGPGRLADALREVLVTSYDMHARKPKFFKRWRAQASPDKNATIVDAALSTASAPTYFPSHPVDAAVLIDGGVFAANPSIAAIAEALKRTVDPVPRGPRDLFVVSLGTGSHEEQFEQSQVSRWGRIGWILPRGEDPALIGAMLDGQSDAADHWAHMLLNQDPGTTPDPDLGHGPRYYRLQTELPAGIALDDAGEKALGQLDSAARALISKASADLDAIVDFVVKEGPLPAT
jgi:uncharacterized protein